MTFKEYQKQSKRTCPSLASDKIDLAHMALGIFSEHNELLSAAIKEDNINLGEELADKFWYISNYCTFRGYDLEYEWENRQDFKEKPDLNQCDSYIYSLSELHDLVKKYLAYSKERNILRQILFYIDIYLDMNDVEIERILENNINKLKIRFPNKFTEENAINRDLVSERIELEK